MSRSWNHESPARWDANKARIVGGARAGIFDGRYQQCKEGDLVPGEWWRVEEDGRVVGYGWIDVNWGDAEILLATANEAQGQGIGALILDRLGEEASARGLNYMYNIVRPTHPDGEKITAWLKKRGFSAFEDGRLLRATTHFPKSAR
jgi:N-acetylglutamate synthase-like GNAT family acetyltransferase